MKTKTFLVVGPGIAFESYEKSLIPEGKEVEVVKFYESKSYSAQLELLKNQIRAAVLGGYEIHLIIHAHGNEDGAAMNLGKLVERNRFQGKLAKDKVIK